MNEVAWVEDLSYECSINKDEEEESRSVPVGEAKSPMMKRINVKSLATIITKVKPKARISSSKRQSNKRNLSNLTDNEKVKGTYISIDSCEDTFCKEKNVKVVELIEGVWCIPVWWFSL